MNILVKGTLLSALLVGCISTAHAARSSVNIMSPRNTVNIAKDYTYGYSYLPGDALDVYETPNRKIGWRVNYDFLDQHLLRPVAIAYIDYVPQGVRDCIYNVNQNLREVNNTVNNMLIWEPAHSGISLTRFVINSSIGIGGCFDVAGKMGLDRHRMTFSTVLGKWGVDQGPYMVVPFYGVGTARSLFGDTFDTSYFPYTFFPYWARLIFWATNGIESRAQLVEQEEVLTNSLDPYIQARDFYLMYQEGLVSGNDGVTENPEDNKELEKYLDEIDE